MHAHLIAAERYLAVYNGWVECRRQVHLAQVEVRAEFIGPAFSQRDEEERFDGVVRLTFDRRMVATERNSQVQATIGDGTAPLTQVAQIQMDVVGTHPNLVDVSTGQDPHRALGCQESP